MAAFARRIASQKFTVDDFNVNTFELVRELYKESASSDGLIAILRMMGVRSHGIFSYKTLWQILNSVVVVYCLGAGNAKVFLSADSERERRGVSSHMYFVRHVEGQLLDFIALPSGSGRCRAVRSRESAPHPLFTPSPELAAPAADADATPSPAPVLEDMRAGGVLSSPLQAELEEEVLADIAEFRHGRLERVGLGSGKAAFIRFPEPSPFLDLDPTPSPKRRRVRLM